MDQYTTAIGDLVYIESEPELFVKQLSPNLGSFILGDSGEPKDTMKILKKCRDLRMDIIQNIKLKNKNFDLNSCSKDLDLSFLSLFQKRLLLNRQKCSLHPFHI